MITKCGARAGGSTRPTSAPASRAQHLCCRWPRRWALLLHVIGGTVVTTVGLVQLWLGLTGRISGVHRQLGRLYVVAIAFAATGAYTLTFTMSNAVEHFGFAPGLLMLNVAWITTTAMAVLALRKKPKSAAPAFPPVPAI